MAHYATADPAWFHNDVWAPWRLSAQTPGQPDTDLLIGTASALQDNCLLVNCVLPIHNLVEQYGIAFLRDWLNLMQKRHPLGAAPVDEAVWQLAAELTGEPPAPRHPTACIGSEIVN